MSKGQTFGHCAFVACYPAGYDINAVAYAAAHARLNRSLRNVLPTNLSVTVGTSDYGLPVEVIQ